MTYEIYRGVFIGGATLAVIMLLISVLLFFKLKISNVIGYLSGSNARKAIENIKNRDGGKDNKLAPTHTGSMRTVKTYTSSKLQERVSASRDGPAITARISEAEEPVFSILAEETTLLTSQPSFVSSAEETTLLSAQITEFTTEYTITFIHTDEIIV